MPNNSGKSWSASAHEEMIRLYRLGNTVDYIARQLGRTRTAIEMRLERAGEMTRCNRPTKPWDEPIPPQRLSLTPHYNPCSEIPIPEPLPEPPKEDTMIDRTVTTKTYVGPIDAATMSADSLITTIEQEQGFIERIAALPMSKARTKLLEKHKANLAALNELLEKRVDEEG